MANGNGGSTPAANSQKATPNKEDPSNFLQLPQAQEVAKKTAVEKNGAEEGEIVEGEDGGGGDAAAAGQITEKAVEDTEKNGEKKPQEDEEVQEEEEKRDVSVKKEKHYPLQRSHLKKGFQLEDGLKRKKRKKKLIIEDDSDDAGTRIFK